MFDILIEAMTVYEKNPRNSVQRAGEVLEDFLRIVANERDVDISNASGISQISQILREKKYLPVNILEF